MQSVGALRQGRVWHGFSCFVLVLMCFVQIEVSGKEGL